MRAARLREFSGPEGLAIEEVPSPAPGRGQVLVAVEATALNRADLLQTMGLYPAPPGVPADIPGIEYAGVVQAIGEGVTRWRPGDRVMGLVGGGAWAEELVTHEREAIAIPPGLSFEEAAAVPEAFVTAFDALTLQAGLKAGQTVLIHAVGSGVGTAAVQWAKSVGAKTVGTARTASKLERAKLLGLELGILVDGAAPSFAAQVKADVVLDLVGGGYLAETLAATAPRGIVMLVGLTAGASADVPLLTLLSKRLTLKGTTLRSRTLEEKIVIAEAFTAQVLPAFVRGELKPVVGATVKLEQLPVALGRMAGNDTFGKTVVTL